MRCLGCNADYPESEIKRLKESARKILDMPEDRATAERGNPLRHGVTAGYALGRCKAVAGSEDVQHPRAFADVALMPPPPPRDQCSLPNPRLITAGAALDRDGGGGSAWRDMLERGGGS